jgi:hypothetical protein
VTHPTQQTATQTAPTYAECQTLPEAELLERFRAVVSDPRFNHARAGDRIYRGSYLLYFRDAQSPSGVVLVGVMPERFLNDAIPVGTKAVLGPDRDIQPH